MNLMSRDDLAEAYDAYGGDDGAAVRLLWSAFMAPC